MLQLIFEGLWSNITHPKDFPFSLWLTHFSDVIGGSHNRNFTLWQEGQIASDSLRQVAEWGSVRSLEQELRTKVFSFYFKRKTCLMMLYLKNVKFRHEYI